MTQIQSNSSHMTGGGRHRRLDLDLKVLLKYEIGVSMYRAAAQ